MEHKATAIYHRKQEINVSGFIFIEICASWWSVKRTSLEEKLCVCVFVCICIPSLQAESFSSSEVR